MSEERPYNFTPNFQWDDKRWCKYCAHYRPLDEDWKGRCAFEAPDYDTILAFETCSKWAAPNRPTPNAPSRAMLNRGLGVLAKAINAQYLGGLTQAVRDIYNEMERARVNPKEEEQC